MTGGDRIEIADAWDGGGRASAQQIGDATAVVILGADATATARVARGLALELAGSREVVLGDVWGDLPEIDSLVGAGDHHGFADHFLFGVSLRRVEQRSQDHPRLTIIRSGTDDVSQQEILASPEWDTTIARYRDMGATLVLAARHGVPGSAALCARAGAVLVVGGAAAEGLPNVRGRVRRGVPSQPPGAASLRVITPRSESQTSPWTRAHRWPVAALIVLVTAGVVAIASRRPAGNAGDTLLNQSAGLAFAGATQQESPPFRPLLPANPEDSARSSAWGIELGSVSTRSGAAIRAQSLSAHLASTVSPVTGSDGGKWFRVYVGAYRSREQADSLHAQLLASEQLSQDAGRVVALPYALLLSRSSSDSTASAELARYHSMDLSAYILRQADGTLNIYTGAFETAEQAALLLDLCTSKDVTAQLVFRTGG